MKLILTSQDLYNLNAKDVIVKNMPKPLAECKMLFIPSGSVAHETIYRLCQFGFTKQNLIFFDHEKSENYVGLDIDLIYAGGGNTFTLLNKIRKSGFDKHIIEYVNSGVVYIGVSAGAHIVTQNIEHVKRYDDNNVGLEDFSGLGLFDSILLCHYTTDRREHLNELEKQGKYKIQHLTDSDSIVVTDFESVIITEHGSFVME